ncbi:hypothetical protein ACJJTC_015335 [Scirpophaga incertulas]
MLIIALLRPDTHFISFLFLRHFILRCAASVIKDDCDPQSNNARNIIGLPLFDTSTKAVERRARFEAPADIVTTGVGPDDVILLLSFEGASIVEAKLVVACNAADNVDGCTSICARQLPRRGESNEEERNDFDLLKL